MGPDFSWLWSGGIVNSRVRWAGTSVAPLGPKRKTSKPKSRKRERIPRAIPKPCVVIAGRVEHQLDHTHDAGQAGACPIRVRQTASVGKNPVTTNHTKRGTMKHQIPGPPKTRRAWVSQLSNRKAEDLVDPKHTEGHGSLGLIVLHARGKV